MAAFALTVAAAALAASASPASGGTAVAAPAGYDARIAGREILTPAAPAAPRFTGPTIYGARPGKPLHFRVSATGAKPLTYAATGLPTGVTLDPATGWITGRVPAQPGDITLQLQVTNAHGRAERALTLRVGETICLTPPMGWNSWYVHSEGVSDQAIREMAQAMADKGLTDHGWTFVNIDDCWSGLRDPATKAIQPNAKFPDMTALVAFVNARGLKLGLYSTAWMSTYAGHVGGSAPNEACDYSAYFVPPEKRENPEQPFGRYPNGIRKGLATIGPVWLVDRDARQFAAWGIEYVKYDWIEQTLKQTPAGYAVDKTQPQRKTEAVSRRVSEDLRAVDRDIVISFSPHHRELEDTFVPKYCNLWRLTGDIDARWPRLIAPFEMGARLQLTGPGHFGDLDMLQIGPLGEPNRAEKVFKPSPLTPAEQYFQVTLWCLFTQPLLLSCHVPTMDAFDLNLVTNDEVLAIDQDPLCRPAQRVAHVPGQWEIWAKDLADGGKAVGLFNLADTDQVLSLDPAQLGLAGAKARDLWRQRDLGVLAQPLSAHVSAHGVLLLRLR